jgi:hypothetical protein
VNGAKVELGDATPRAALALLALALDLALPSFFYFCFSLESSDSLHDQWVAYFLFAIIVEDGP